MKKVLLILTLVVSSATYAQNAGDIEGVWYMPPDANGNTAVAKIYNNGNSYQAFSFIYTNEGVIQKNDVKNPDTAKRNRPLKGMVFLSGLEFKGKEWHKGTIYRPDDGKSFHARVKISADKNTLTIRASIDGAGLMGKTLTWNRADAKYLPLADQVKPY